MTSSGSLSIPTPSPVDRALLDADAGWLAGRLRSSRLTVLCGDGSPALSGVVTEGVLPRLQRRSTDGADPTGAAAPQEAFRAFQAPERRQSAAHDTEAAVFFDQWTDSAPREALLRRIHLAIGVPSVATQAGATRTLADALVWPLRRFSGRLLLVLDQFDDCLDPPPDRPDVSALRDEIFEAVNREGAQTHFLIALRRCRAGDLDTLRQRLRGFDAGRPLIPPGRAATDAGRAEPGAALEQLLQLCAPALAGASLADLERLSADISSSLAGLYAPAAGPAVAVAGPTLPEQRERLGWPRQPQQTEPPRADEAPARPGQLVTATHWPVVPAAAARPARPESPSTSALVPAVPAAAWVAPVLPARLARLPRQPARTAARALPAGLAVAVALVAALTLWLTFRATAPMLADVGAMLDAAPPAAGVAVAPASLAPRPVAETPVFELRAPSDTAARIADELVEALRKEGAPAIARRGSDGWAEDLAALRSGDQLAIARYDALRAVARAPSGSASAPAAPALRVVMPLFLEELLFVVRADSPLRHIHEIEGRRLGTGATGSARALTARTAYERLFGVPAPAAAGPTEDVAALQQLLAGHTDVAVLVGAAPGHGLVGLPLTDLRGLRLLALDAGHPASQRALQGLLPARLTRGLDDLALTPPVPTLAVLSFLVAGAGPAAAAADPALGRVALALCRQLPELQRGGHPKWRELQPGLQLDVGWPDVQAVRQALRVCIDAPMAGEPAANEPTVARTRLADSPGRSALPGRQTP